MATFRKTKTGWEAQIARQGHRKSKTFKTKVLAEQWAAETEFTLVGGKSPLQGMTVGEMLWRYETEAGANWSRSKANFANLLGRSMGDKKVADLTQLSLMRWFTDESPYAATTSEYMLKTLQGALAYARTAWTLEVPKEAVGDALKGLRVKGKLTPINERDRRVTPDEEALLVKHWGSRGVSSDVVPFLIDTPMRSGEMCALKWTDVDGVYVTIRDRKDPKKKIGNHQKIKLLGRSVDILKARKTLAPFPWTQQQISGAVRKAARAAGLDDLRCHDLRHEGISRLFERGWQIQQVAIISGHKTWKTLQRYTHVSAESLPD
jgi:integrase